MLRFNLPKVTQEESDAEDRKEDSKQPDEQQKLKSAVSKHWRKGASQVCLASKSGWTKAVQTQHLLRISALTAAPQNRADTDLDVIDELFIRAGPFRAFNRNMRVYLARKAELATFGPGQYLFRAGDPATNMYVMLDGEVHIMPVTDEEEDADVTVLRNFDSVGQELLADLNNRQLKTCWDCSALAVAPAHAAVISRELLLEAWEEEGHPDMQELTEFLHSIPAFELLGVEKLNSLALHARLRHVNKDGVVFKQDSEPDELFIVRSGYVRFLRQMHVPNMRDKLVSHGRQLKPLSSLHPAYFASIVHHADALYPDRSEDAESSSPSDQSHHHPSGCMTHRARLQRGLIPTGRHGQSLARSEGTQGSLPVLQKRQSLRGSTRLWGGHIQAQTPDSGDAGDGLADVDEDSGPRSQRRVTVPPLRASPIPPSVSLLGSCRMPRLRDETPQMELAFVDLGTLGTGQCFGGLGAIEKGGRRACSAVADTHLELVVLTRTDFQMRLPDKLSRFIGTMAVHEFGFSDDEVRMQLDASMQWEVYKKTLVSEVLTDKARTQSLMYKTLRYGRV